MGTMISTCSLHCVGKPESVHLSSGATNHWDGPPQSQWGGKAQLHCHIAAPFGFWWQQRSSLSTLSGAILFHSMSWTSQTVHSTQKNPKTTTSVNQQQLYAELFKLFRKRIKILAMPSCWNTVWLFPVAQQRSIPIIHGCSSFLVPPGRCWVTFSPLQASPAPRPQPKAVPTELLKPCWRCWCSHTWQCPCSSLSTGFPAPAPSPPKVALSFFGECGHPSHLELLPPD